MSDNVLIAVVLCSGVILFKLLDVLSKVSGAGMRSSERERKEYFRMIQIMSEKRDTTDKVGLARVHSQERMTNQQIDAAMEKPTTNRKRKSSPKIFSTREEREIGSVFQ